MAHLLRSSLQSSVACIIVFTQLTGCVSLKDVQEVRRLPEPSLIDIYYTNIFYDPDIRAYRLRTVSGGRDSVFSGMALRDGSGKKIRTEQDLARFLQTIRGSQLESEKEGKGTKIAYTVGLIVYLPVLIVVGVPLGVIDGVLNIPFSPIPGHLVATYQDKAEAAYARGREQFDSGKYDKALTEWDYAKHLMPSLQGNSDIDYWRGRAFESRHESNPAITAYQEFLDYSERSTPTYFHYSYPEDPRWAKKAEEAEKREWVLINTLSLSAQESQSHLSNE